MLPNILTQLGAEGLTHLKRLAVANSKLTDDEVPDLVGNFEEAANTEGDNKAVDDLAQKTEEVTVS